MASFFAGMAQELVDGHADPETGIIGAQAPVPQGESDERRGHHPRSVGGELGAIIPLAIAGTPAQTIAGSRLVVVH